MSGKEYITYSVKHTEEEYYSAYTSTGGYVGDFRSALTSGAAGVYPTNVKKRTFELSTPFTTSSTLVKPWYRRIKTEGEDNRVTSDTYGIDITKKFIEWGGTDISFVIGCELTNHKVDSSFGKKEYQEHRGKIGISIEY
jgi:hypothetical protein